MSISQFRLIPNNLVQVFPSNPTGTTSLSGVMCGLAIPFTPKMTGKVIVMIQALGANDTLGDDGTLIKGYFGTGTAPSNGDAPTGTGFTNDSIQFSPILAKRITHACTAIKQNLVLGTTYWFDLLQSAQDGGTATITQISYSINEVQA